MGVLLSSASLAQDDPDDGLPRPVLGAEIYEQLQDPAKWQAAFRDLVIRKAEADKDDDTDFSKIPPAIFFKAYTDIRITPCPGGQDDEAPEMLMITYESHWGVINDIENPASDYDLLAYPVPQEELDQLKNPKNETVTALPLSKIEQKPGDLPLPDHVIVFIDSDGKIRWPFGGSNMFNRGFVLDVNRDGVLDRVDTTNWGVPKVDGKSMSASSVEIETASIPSKSLLHIFLNWHPSGSDAEEWTFDVTDRDGDGISEIEIGPLQEDEDGNETLRETRAVFKWDSKTGEYVGPKGGQGKHWMLVPKEDRGENFWPLVKKLGEQGGLNYPLTPAPKPEPVVAKPVVEGITKARVPGPWEIPWEKRKPYVHKTLKNLPNDELANFAFGGKPTPPPPPSADGSPASPFDFQKPNFPDGLFKIPPRQAALALAEANRLPANKDLFRLIIPEENPAPPKHGTILFETQPGWAVQYWEGFIFGNESNSQQTPVYRSVGSLRTEKFPTWRDSCRLHRVSIPNADAMWLAETLWWLNQIRSVLKNPGDKIPDSNRPGFDDVTYARLNFASDSGNFQSPFDFGISIQYHWKGRYDRSVAQSLSMALWEKFSQDLFPSLAQNSYGRANQNNSDVVTESLEIAKEILSQENAVDAWRIPAILETAIATIGDSGASDLAPLIGKVFESMTEISEAENVANSRNEVFKAAETDYKKKKIKARFWWDLRDDYERYLVEHPFDSRKDLRAAIELAKRQLAEASDTESLVKWSGNEEEIGAAWALNFLKTDKKTSVFTKADRIEKLWKTAQESDRYISGESLRQLYEIDPEEVVNRLIISKPGRFREFAILELAEIYTNAEKPPELWMVPDLIVGLKTQERDDLRKVIYALVPMTEPDRFAELPEIEDILAQRLTNLLEHFDNQSWAVVRALISISKADEHWDLVKKYHMAQGQSFGSINQVGRIASRAPARRAEFGEMLVTELKTRASMVNQTLANLAWADTVSEHVDFLAQIATHSPDEPSGPNSDRGSSDAPEIHGGFHLARLLVAAEKEPDELTRLKLKIAIAIHLEREIYLESQDKPAPTYLARFRNALTAENQDELIAWMDTLDKFLKDDPKFTPRPMDVIRQQIRDSFKISK